VSGAEAARAAALTSPPLSFLPRPIREPRRPAVALTVALLTTFIPSIAIAGVIGLFAPDAAQPQFDVDGAKAIFLLAVFAPVLETLIMGAVLLILLRVASPAVAVLLSALGWGIAHSLATPIWGLVIWWPFLIFSTLFVVWRQRSLAAAFAMPMIAHGLHNLPSALLLVYGKTI
jgi:hypothetical protein